MAKPPLDALSPRSEVLMTYALCGFANFGSLGILIGGLSTMVPERREEGAGKPGPRMALFGAPRRQRLLRYCAHPIYAGERLQWAKPGERLLYNFPEPRPDGQTTLSLTPPE